MKARALAQIAALGLAATVLTGCAADAVSWDRAQSSVGETARVCGPLVSMRSVSESWGDATFFNLGVDYPDLGRFTVVVWESASPDLEDLLVGKEVCATGPISLYEGSPQLEVDSLSDLSAPELEGDMDPPGSYPGAF